MAFKIKIDEPVGRALRRLARRQLGHAFDVLGDARVSRSERVHDLRTSIKKVRALIDVAHPSGGRAATRADRELRQVASSVASLRDSEVSLETFDGLLPLVEAAGPGIGPSLRRARRGLAAHLQGANKSFDDSRLLDRTRRKLRRARRHTRRWLPAKGAGPRLRDGLFAGYRRARRAQERAYAKNSAAAFHRWRREVKAHRYQMQLLEELWPGEAAAHVELLERLGELLGQDHDLTVLEETMARDDGCRPEAEECGRLLAAIERRRQELRAAARSLGDRLFAERPRAFRRRLRDELRAGGDAASVNAAAAAVPRHTGRGASAA